MGQGDAIIPYIWSKNVVLKCKVIAPVCYLFQETVLNDWQELLLKKIKSSTSQAEQHVSDAEQPRGKR